MSVPELHDRICQLWCTNSYGIYDLSDTQGRVLEIINDRRHPRRFSRTKTTAYDADPWTSSGGISLCSIWWRIFSA